MRTTFHPRQIFHSRQISFFFVSHPLDSLATRIRHLSDHRRRTIFLYEALRMYNLTPSITNSFMVFRNPDGIFFLIPTPKLPLTENLLWDHSSDTHDTIENYMEIPSKHSKTSTLNDLFDCYNLVTTSLQCLASQTYAQIMIRYIGYWARTLILLRNPGMIICVEIPSRKDTRDCQFSIAANKLIS